MKRLSNFLIVALAALFFAVGFAACGSNGGNGTGGGIGGGDKPSGEHTHTFIETVIEPTCTEKGYTIHKCECGEKYEDSYVSALDHKLGEWKVTTPATEEKDGEETRACTRENCDYTETRKIPALSHIHEYTETVVEPTCTEKGYTLHKCECGEEYKDGETKALGHLFGEWEIVTPATEDSEGLERRTCARENCDFKEERKIPVLSHTHNYIMTTIEPTCTERGYTKYTCEKCGNSYNADYKKALGHDYSTEWTVDEKATCQKTGIKSHHCTRCNAKTDETEIPLADHNYVDGVCTVCGNKTIEEATGLEYTLSADYTYYIVSDLGKETRTRFIIPATYNGRPVKEIGEVAFYKKVDIIQVILPDSIERIGGSAFNGCSNLQEIQLGNGLLTIGEKAFNECSRLDNLVIPSSVNEINKNAFSNCHKLIKYIKGVGYVDKWAIESDDLVTKVELKADTVGIADSAFYGCNSLTSITIPDSITSVGDDAFCGCDSLKGVYITDIAAWCNIKFDGYFSNPLVFSEKLYLNNKLVTDLVIPDSVTRIGNYAFHVCTSLTSVTIPDSVMSIGGYAFRCCRSLASITIGNGVTSIGENAFDVGNSLKGVYITDIAAWCNIKFDGYFSNPLVFSEKLYLNNKLVTDLVISDGVTSIGSLAFAYCSLTSITIPDSVTSIGHGAFYGCDLLEKINVRDNNARYASVDGILYDKNKTEIILVPNNIKGDVTIPDSVTSIGNSVFSSRTSLKSVTIGNGVTSIGDYAFSSCSSLTSVNIPDSVTSIGDSAFYNCSIEEATVPAIACQYLSSAIKIITITSGDIPNAAFYECRSLTSVTIGGSVTSIGSSAFDGCYSLTSITIPDSVTSIGDSAFYGCRSLTSVTIPNSVTSIGSNAFMYCRSLTSVTIGKSVASIGDNAFYGCSSLTSITIPDSVTSIGDSAFGYCELLMDITYNGTKAEWKKITKGNNWKWDWGDFTVHCTDGDLTHEEA